MRSNKNQIQSLDRAISLLETQRKNEFIVLKSQFHDTYEHFKPVNLLNQTIKDLRGSTEIKNNLFETLISITGGYFSKRLFIGKSKSIVKNIFGFVLQYTITNFISKKVSKEQ